MKRLILGLVTLALLPCGLWWSIRTQTRNIEALIDDIQAIETAFTAENAQQCSTLCEQFPVKVKQRTRLLPLFSRHEELHALEEAAACLPVLYAQTNKTDFSEELTRCKVRLQQLRDMEKPIWGNVF